MKDQITTLAKTVGKNITQNSPAILSGLGVAGVVTTGYLSATGALKAAQWLAQAEAVREIEREENPDLAEDLTLKDKLKIVWPAYIPAVAVGAVTIAAIITSQSISARRQAAVVSLYSITEKAYTEYREKVIDKIGEKAEVEIRDEIIKDRVAASASNAEVLIFSGSEDQVCYDVLTGRYFKSTWDKILKAQNDLNNSIIRNEYASQNEWFLLLGLDPLPYGDELGWNHGNMIEVHPTSTLLPDNKPALAINYKTEPLSNYYRTF